ncbi:MAG: alpha/beta fold hydrolase [Phycisphaerae bacterium]
MNNKFPEYPFASHYLDIDGLRMHYLDEGNGPPVVMVHGNPSWSYYYRNLVAQLRDRFRCIVPDHIGCGLSDKPGDDRYEYTLERRVTDLEKLLDSLNVRENITWIVHDWGGMIGLTTALRNFDGIARVVVLNTSGFFKPATKSLPWQLRLTRSPLGALLVQGCNLFAVGATWTGTKTGMPRAIRKAYCAPYNSWSNRIATLRFVQDIPLTSQDRSYALVKWTDDNLHKLAQKPMMIAWGRHDFVFDDHFLHEWQRRFPNVPTHIFEYAGHYVLEDAADELIPLIDNFLQERSVTERGSAAARPSTLNPQPS